MSLAASSAPRRRSGREWEPETQLYFYRARFYDAKIGRFLSEDPLRFQADSNFYRYVLDNPVNLIDPMGLDVQVCTRQMRNFFEGVPHTVVYPTSRKTNTGPGTGPCIASGFGPAKGLPVGTGAIVDEPICDDYGNRSPEYSCSTASTSDCVEKCVERKIGESKKKPPRYQVGPKFLGGNQCTDWSDKTVGDCQKDCAGRKRISRRCEMSSSETNAGTWRIPGLDWLGGTLLVAAINAGFYWFSYWRSGWETPHLGTYLCAVGALVSFAFVPREVRNAGLRWGCLVGLALSAFVLWHIFTAPCIGPCK